MSYAIVRNEKLTRAEVNGKCTHNDRKAKNHTNKDIDSTRTHLNYYIKKNNYTYTKEFDKFKDNLKKFIKWLCHKFSYPCEDDLIRDFNKKTYSNINFEKQLDTSHFEKEDNEIDFEM